jgi:hypothetical protein
MLYKNKNIVAKLKNQNGGLIQDGAKNIFLFLSVRKFRPYPIYSQLRDLTFFLLSPKFSKNHKTDKIKFQNKKNKALMI